MVPPFIFGIMKRIILFSLLSFIVTNLYAQDEDSKIVFPMLKSVKELNYRFDYSQMYIDKIEGKDYFIIDSETEDPDKEYQNYTNKVNKVFISAVNSELLRKGYKLSNKDSLRFEVVFFITKVDKDGGHKVIGVIIDKEAQKEITQLMANAGGGKLNSTKVLFLEELRKSGEEFGERLAIILTYAGKKIAGIHRSLLKQRKFIEY